MPAPAFRSSLLMLAGACLLLPFDRLPPLSILLAAALPVTLLAARHPAVLLVAVGCLALHIDAARVLDDRLDHGLAGSDITAAVRIVDFPAQGTISRLVVTPLDTATLPVRLRLAWYADGPVPGLGECWEFTMRLQRPRGFANPGRFDYEAWLFTRRIGATGYVRAGKRLETCPAAGRLMTQRGRLRDRLLETLPPGGATAILLAVTLGARQWIEREQWQRFAATGTSHLMAISGMHIALASGAVYLLLRALAGGLGVPGNQRVAAAAGALGFAALYAAVSGFAIPSRRALVMLAIAVAGFVLRQRLAAWQVLGLAALGAFALAPLDVLAPGFRLSFSAVALLIWLAANRSSRAPGLAPGGPARRARDLARLQVMLLFGLLPLTALLFGRLTWTSPAVNLLVVPVFNLLALPAALAGLVSGGDVGDWLLFAAWYAVRFIIAVVDAGAALPLADVTLPRPGLPALLAVAAATLYAVLPRGWPGRQAGLLALPVLLFGESTRPPPGCADIDVLDVGQGLATVVATHRHTLVYDAGPAFRSGSDTGELVVRPFLDYRGIRSVDLLVISHADLDHAGGTQTLRRDLDVRAVLEGEPSDGFRCRSGQAWHWDGIGFAVLYPDDADPQDGNNASCVVEIRAGQRRALLTGDIEARAERLLVARDLLSPSELVVIPHHGSNTSSHRGFLDALGPAIGVASAGHDNRWGMPRPEVVARWRDAGAAVLDTAGHGALGFRLCAEGGLRLRYRQRIDRRRFWHEE